MAVIKAEVLIDGRARGPIKCFAEPISFWGGVSPETGLVTDPRHPAKGETIAGSILLLAATRGSSSSSAVMLELLRRRRAPAAMVLAEPDAILTLGVVVAEEMGYETIPVLRLPVAEQAKLAAAASRATIRPGGIIETE